MSIPHAFPQELPARIARGSTRALVEEGWELCQLAPGLCKVPAHLVDTDARWISACVPGTSAQALQMLATDEDYRDRSDLDAYDTWYRCVLPELSALEGTRAVLEFDGLATLAEAWLNEELVLTSQNMFVQYRLDITEFKARKNILHIRFRALDPELSRRRPRPRWKTRLVQHQNLRWCRTTLLGRMPSWSPPCAAVGPWKRVSVVVERDLSVLSYRLRAHVEDRGSTAAAGAAELRMTLGILTNGAAPRSGRLYIGDAATELVFTPGAGDTVQVRARITLPHVRLWWPHTHGDPYLYDVRVALTGFEDGTIEIDCGRVGFRSIVVDRGDDDSRFQVRVNGIDVFCRGACWTTVDILALSATRTRYAELLVLARDSGLNMFRVGGTMVYEDDCFYDLCDELGILVWQDFMFANMDYPMEDECFARSVESECRQQLQRLGGRACLAVLCGGSEVAQQASMLGLGSDEWDNELFADVLPRLIREACVEAPYLPSTPWGGALPFRIEAGVSHYFGVGAYLRPVADASLRSPRFASECLAFSNPPEHSTLEGLSAAGEVASHHPSYKARVPRDAGAGWDFADVTDHYVEALFGLSARRQRHEDAVRYLHLCRISVGEVVAETMGRWRAGDSPCAGALIWYYSDLWEGAGWGIVDSLGLPKAPYYYLKRIWAPVAMWFLDRGLDGLQLVVANDKAQRLTGRLKLVLYRGADTEVERREIEVDIAGRAHWSVDVETVLGRFIDATHAYRFGPAAYDMAVATLRPRDGQSVDVAPAYYFPSGGCLPMRQDIGLRAQVVENDGCVVSMEVATRGFAQAVTIQVRGYVADDNYFHLAPGSRRLVRLRAGRSDVRFRGRVAALNVSGSARIVSEI
ncbi:MAG: hypothetical protein V3V08_16095 [Nannocystaceae bacterium]